MEQSISYPKGSHEEASIRGLKTYGFLVKSVVGTNNHILYFCAAPFGRLCVVIEDNVPSHINAKGLEADASHDDSLVSIVEDGTICITYPSAEGISYYETTAEVANDKYYITELSSIYSNPEHVSVEIDNYFTIKSQEFFNEKMKTVKLVNKVVASINEKSKEASSLESKITSNYREMNKLRDASMALIREGRYDETIELSNELQHILAATEDDAHEYHTLAEKIMRF